MQLPRRYDCGFSNSDESDVKKLTSVGVAVNVDIAILTSTDADMWNITTCYLQDLTIDQNCMIDWYLSGVTYKYTAISLTFK